MKIQLLILVFVAIITTFVFTIDNLLIKINLGWVAVLLCGFSWGYWTKTIMTKNIQINLAKNNVSQVKNSVFTKKDKRYNSKRYSLEDYKDECIIANTPNY